MHALFHRKRKSLIGVVHLLPLPGSPDWGADPDDAILYEGVTGDSRTLKTARGDQRGYYVALREALLGRASNPVPPEQGATVMAIIEAAFRADAEGCRVVPDLTKEERAAYLPDA